MANNEQNDFSVVQSLFGVDPAQLARARQQADVQAANQEAARVAALPPQQGMVEQQLAGGAGVGRALGPAVQGALGIQQPVDPQMKFARTMQAIMQSLPQAGIDPSDPIAAQQYVGKALMQAGFPQQGMMALENARLRSQEQQKTQAEIAKNVAQAHKDLADAEPVAKAFASGHITPQSYAKYVRSGKDVSVLQPTDKYMIANTNDGVFAVSKSDPNTKVRLGDIKPGAGGDKQAALDRFNTTTQPYRKEDGSVDWEGFQKADPAAAMQAKLDARVAFGAANLSSVTGGGGNVEGMAQAIARGDMAAPPGRTQFTADVMKRVMELNPKWSASTFNTKNATMLAFSKGPEARTVRSFGVLQDHLGTLEEAIGALKNGQNQLPNAIRNKIADWTGGPGPGNFDAVRDIVGDELAKAIIGGVNALGDREAIQKRLTNAKSPEQLAGIITNYRKLAEGQLAGLKRQYEGGTGNTDFETRILQQAKPATAGDKTLLKEGITARDQGTAAYSAWWKTKTPEEKAAFKAAVEAARSQ